MRYARLLMVLSMLSLALFLSFTTASGSDVGTWAAASPMSYVRFGHQSVLLPDGRVFVVGGHYKDFNFSGPAEIYDPKTGTWSVAGWPQGGWTDMTRITLLHNGKVLVVGAYPPELYDPSANTWTMAGTMNGLRAYGATATLLSNGKVLVTGGDTAAANGAPASSAELYDPETNTWSPAASMVSERYGAAAALLPSGKVLVAGGETPFAELYDPETNIWSYAGYLDTVRYGHTLTALADGKLLLAGGYLAGSAMIYDPAINEWSNFSVMPSAIYSHTATLLPDGKVLVVGGHTDNNVPPSPQAWLYDPATNNWSLDSSMSTGRFLHSAVLLPNGSVLVTGGRTDAAYWIQDATWVATSEIRTQAERTFAVSGSLRESGDSGAAVSGVKVAIAGMKAVSQPDGTFSMSGIPAGTYTLRIVKPGYLPKIITEFAINGDISGLDYSLTRVPFSGPLGPAAP